ncbi:MAG: M56 family metallopeptidase [Lentisphaerae bacterium]|nr:M56 family metallopeptidase [Lentisphaerota bacterium]
MSELIVPITVILLRGALAVLILAGAEAIFESCLSARVRRLLWILCIALMMLPQPNLPIHLFAIDLTGYQQQVINVADVLPREIAGIVGGTALAQNVWFVLQYIPGVTGHNYPYLLAALCMFIPALLLVPLSYLRCMRRMEKFKILTDERILRIWYRVCGGKKRWPLLLDSQQDNHPPVLFGLFQQKLLLPVRGLQHLSDSELELLLTHEYMHYRNGDGIINILTLCLWPLNWYNPFFLAARRRLRINCELTCDAEVLKRFPERTVEYGKLLLAYANTATPPEVTLAFREYSGELRSRIIYMTGLAQRRKSSLLITLLLAFILAAPFGLVSAIANPAIKLTAFSTHLTADELQNLSVEFYAAGSNGQPEQSLPINLLLPGHSGGDIRELPEFRQVYLKWPDTAIGLQLRNLQTNEIIPVKSKQYLNISLENLLQKHYVLEKPCR